VASLKGNSEAVAAKEREGLRNRLKGALGRSTLEKEKPPVFWRIYRRREVVIRILANARQVTIELLIKANVAQGTLIYTDEYGIYNRLGKWGCGHGSVNHAAAEYARDDDGDGFCSFLRSLLRPQRGISQNKPS